MWNGERHPGEKEITSQDSGNVLRPAKRGPLIYAWVCLAVTTWGCSHSSTSAKSHDSGDGAVEAGQDETAPILDEIEPVPKITSDVTPLYRFSSSKPGRILYRGSCGGDMEQARVGENLVHLGPLTDGEYRDCALAVEDERGNLSQWLGIRAFVVDTQAPSPPTILTRFKRTGQERPSVLIGGEAFADILADNSVVGSIASNGIGSATLGPFLDGTQTISFRLRDLAGNVSGPVDFSFVTYSHLAVCEQDGLEQRIHDAWQALTEYLQSSVSHSGTTPYVLYEVQILTAPLLRYALRHRDSDLLDSLASIYAGAADTLTWTDQYVFYYFPDPGIRASTHTLDRAYPIWVDPNSGAESVLVSAQFLYAVSRLVRYAAELDANSRSAALQEIIERFGDVLSDHYRRWVLGVTVDDSLHARGPFQLRGWGCRYNGQYVETGMNHTRLTNLRLAWALGDDSSPKYCNAVTDSDLWIYAGVANLVAACEADPSIGPEDQTELDAYRLYLDTASVLLASRAQYRPCQDFDGNSTECAGFDEGMWDDHPGHAYTGYTGDAFPDPNQQARAEGVGWDVSHARRLVEVMETLYELAPDLGLDFPNDRFMTGLARNLAHIIFLGDERLPLFTNFCDGTNGWYRVNYSGRTGFGYAPSDLSIALLTGGYALWIEYYLPLKRVYEATYAMITSQDPEVQAFWHDHYEQCFYSDYERHTCLDLSDTASRTTQLFWLQYLSGICF